VYNKNMEIIINLTEAETKALSYVAFDPQEWAENAVKERARIAMEEIFQTEAQRMLADPTVTSIPADREAVVLAADIKSAAERQAEADLANGDQLSS
jgi:hypothetical protein